MAKTTKAQRNRRTKRAREASWRENPIKEITITPEWYGSLQGDTADFAIAALTGFIWEVRHRPDFCAVHPDLLEFERIRDHLVWLQKKEHFLPTEDEDLQLTLIDFIRVLPKMWD